LTREMSQKFAAVLDILELGFKQPRSFAPTSR